MINLLECPIPAPPPLSVTIRAVGVNNNNAIV